MVRPPPPDYLRQQSDWSSKTSANTIKKEKDKYGNAYTLQQLNSTDTQESGHRIGIGSDHLLPSHRQQQPTTLNNNNSHPTRTPGVAPSNTTAVKRNLTRAKTLTRPDRHVTPAPLLNPTLSSPNNKSSSNELGLFHISSWWHPWAIYIYIITLWAPGWALSACGMKQKTQQRAWREKVALCSIALVLGGCVGFLTIGLNRALCPDDQGSTANEFIRLGEQAGYLGIQGWMFNVTSPTTVNGVNFRTLAQQLSGQDITDLFDTTSDTISSCNGLTGRYATVSLCANSTATAVPCTLAKLTPAYLTSLGLVNSTKRVGFSWEQVERIPNYFVIDGAVCNMNPYVAAFPTPITDDPVDNSIRAILSNSTNVGGKDATRLFYSRTTLTQAGKCISRRYKAGHIDKITPGCFASQLFLYISLVVILAVVLSRFFMALIFSWFLSAKLVKPPKNLKRFAISPAVMPAGANTSVNNATGTAPWVASANAAHRANTVKKTRVGNGGNTNGLSNARGGGKIVGGGGGGGRGSPYDEKALLASAPAFVDQNGMLNMAAIGSELFCVCLVTCYSEGLDSIRTTLDSIAGTDYADSRKLIFVVCDGMITGSGEKMSTPDICVGLLDADSRFDNPQPMSYLAVCAGRKQHNQAMVYAGHYTKVKGHRTPTLIVVKTGTPEEARDPKPGNRGKRDSQMVLMNFFSRVTYNDRMTPLDYDLFRKCQALMGVTPDFFEVCLMVDADTKAFPDSLKQLVNCMQHDNMIMGVCGETRIANKRQSWVTAIQVYEYYISHHLAKAFESVFGGVTCLPGCFSMYRLKARKANDTDWVPVLTQSTIVSEYSQSDVQSLHEKNLLLLGEDRFLTTLMLRTFPHRKMMFCPQARCRTVAPDTFKVLLSQRRRWINSTIHNLMELVRVQDLCGTFCFSMQFVVFMDLLGTIVLPVAICLTYSLIVQSIIHPPKAFSDAIPLLLLAAVLGLPAILIVLATGKIVYVSWMLIYLLSLPIWNFVLPVYSFWHFDDFSWGQTRMVAGEKRDAGHGDKIGETIEVNAVPLRRWEDWERSRIRRLKRENKRKIEFERAFGTRTYHNKNTLSTYTEGESSRMDSSDTGSIFSGGDDRWGMQIGQYAEEPASHLPPVGLYNIEEGASNGETVDHGKLEQMLEAGWDDDLESPASAGVFDSYEGYRGYQQPPYHYSGTSSTTPPEQTKQSYQYQQAPVRMYQLTDRGPVNSNSSLTGLNQDPDHSSSSIESPRSSRRPSPSPDGSRPYGHYLPRGQDVDSPSKTSGYDKHPDMLQRGHIQRRSGGGSGSASFESELAQNY